MKLVWFKSNALDIRSLERVLLINPFGLGDTLFITPVIRALKGEGVKQIDLLLGSRTREVFERNPHITHIFEWDKSRTFGFQAWWKRVKSTVQLFKKIWESHYQAVIDFTPRANYAFISLFFFWIPIRIGFYFKRRGLLLSHRLSLPNGYQAKHVAEYYFDLLKALNVPILNKQMEFFLSEEDQKDAQTILNELGLSQNQSYLTVAVGGGESWGKDARLKRWPVRYFSQLVQKLRHEYPSLFDAVLILGGAGEHALGEELRSQLGGFPTYNLCSKTSVRVAGTLIERAALLIGNDGGLIHLAHALNVPLVAIYGPVDSLVYGPYPPTLKALAVNEEGPVCRPCYQQFRYQEACQGVECLRHLSSDEIMEKIKSSRFVERLGLSSFVK
ncbi:MAG: glycosyltransferase family 9 protein [Candidatus Omnitrophica bacterium]|nr:glycosyltransferase family 9 protein [Candidatus Omnitrophota bacterium]